MARQEFSGSAVPAKLAGLIDDNDTSISITDASGWPTGADYPFVVTIGRGTPAEETILCSGRTGTTLTVQTRGYDGTTAQAHAAGDDIEHTLSAAVLDDLSTRSYNPGSYINLSTLGDVDDVAPDTGDVLTWGGSEWEPAPLPPSSTRYEETSIGGSNVNIAGSEVTLMTLVIPSQGFPHRLDLDAAANLQVGAGNSILALRIKNGSTVLREASIQNLDAGDAVNITLPVCGATLNVPGGGGSTITLVGIRVSGAGTSAANNNTARQFLRAIVVPT